MKRHPHRTEETQAQMEHVIENLEMQIGRNRSLLQRSQRLVAVLSATLSKKEIP